MLKEYLNAIENRRSYYAISNEKVATDEEIQSTIEHIVKHTPSAYNSQSARMVLLLGDNHKKFWDITKEALRKVVPEENFADTESRIDGFAAGYGTVLFYEDQTEVKKLQDKFPQYKDNFAKWSLEASGMHQINTWTALEAMGFGATLQHYNELIEEDIRKEFDLPEEWQLRAQMPFGKPTSEAGDKEFAPIEKRVLVFK